MNDMPFYTEQEHNTDSYYMASHNKTCSQPYDPRSAYYIMPQEQEGCALKHGRVSMIPNTHQVHSPNKTDSLNNME